MFNHMPQTLASALLSLALVGFTLIPVGGALEWYYASELNKIRGIWFSTIVATGLLTLATAFWLIAVAWSFTAPISSFQFIGIGMFLSLAALFGYFYVSMQRQRLTRVRNSVH